MVEHLTASERSVLLDDQYLVTKQEVSDKIIAHLAQIERKLNHEIKQTEFAFPARTFLKSGKISKGENYQSLPFFILDYPRLFTKTDVFAFRTMLWWGKEFSCTLHLAGDPLQQIKKGLSKRLKEAEDVYFCIHQDPWEYHFGAHNYQQIMDLEEETMDLHIETRNFIKISMKISLTQWTEFEEFTLKTFNHFLRIIY